MKLTLAEAAIGASAVLEAPSSFVNAGALMVSGYSIDSRTVSTNDLFFAVRGERFDGHDFVASAIARGAVAAVVSRARVATLPDAALAVPLLIAEDPLLALQSLALHVRRQWGKRVVAITGSAGKTTTKEAVAAALAAKFHVLKSQGNLNNAFGIPLQLLRLEPEHDIAVVEMGMNHSGEIAALCRIATPDWGVVTNVGTAHIENFAEGQAGIARAKFELVAALPSTGVAFLNCCDPYVSQFGRDFPGRVVYFGEGPCADPQIVAVSEDLSGLHIQYRAREHEGTFTLGLLGQHNASNAMAGLAVALEAGVDLDAAIAALQTLSAGDKRGEIIEIAGATILNDSYNSNPEALRSMIRTLAARPATGRRILVAGEMLEQGEHGPELHAACGLTAAEAALDLVAGVQGNAKHLVTAASSGGVASLFLPDAEAAGDWLIKNILPGDVVLIKGSRGVHLERAIEALKSHSNSPEKIMTVRRILVTLVLLITTLPLFAETRPEWTNPHPPFRIAGNLYYVGSQDLASYLIVTPQGDILINSNLESSVPQIKQNVETLGFKFSDVKILLISHSHWDHCAGSAAILKLTGAKYYVMDGDVSVVESGGKTDFHYGNDPDTHYPAAHVDRTLHDGSKVTLGGTTLTAHLTAGHTKGTTTWTLDLPESGRTFHAVIVGSPNVNSGYKLVGNKTFPNIADAYKQGFKVLNALPCDLFLGAHGAYFDLAAKYPRFKAGDKNAFIDPAGYTAYITEREHAFQAELARQQAK